MRLPTAATHPRLRFAVFVLAICVLIWSFFGGHEWWFWAAFAVSVALTLLFLPDDRRRDRERKLRRQRETPTL